MAEEGQIEMKNYLSVILSITTAGLYTLGFTYHQGYLREFGITDSLFPLSVDRALFEGFVSLSSMGATAVVWFILAAEGVLILAVTGTFVLKLMAKKKWFVKSFSQITNESPGTKNDEDGNSFIMFSKTMLMYSLVLFFMFIGILFVLIASDKSGTEAAKRFKGNAINKKIKYSKIILRNTNIELEGAVIASSRTNVAFLTTDKVVVLNMSDIARIDSR